jgi:hypothetical protein
MLGQEKGQFMVSIGKVNSYDRNWITLNASQILEIPRIAPLAKRKAMQV